jgi:hypothetical protein
VGLTRFLQKVSRGETDWQVSRRYERASNRGLEYSEVVQWYAENADGSPTIVDTFDNLVNGFSFRASVRHLALASRSDVERKLGHAKTVAPGCVPWIVAFLRPSDRTVYCFYVLLRDKSQQFAVMTPYWFLDRGEKQGDYKARVVDAI